jgi:predicted porin
MKKKLMVAAVAGALAAPGLALAAQPASQVQLYGLFNVEYAPYVDNIDHPTLGSRNKTDEFNSGASRIGFRGQENLGGGLAAWFQCETDVRFLNGSASSVNSVAAGNWCDRNSALGLRGGWGNLYLGTWDTPAKRVTSATRMLNETGWLGAQRLLMTHAGFNYSHRATNTINYDTPNFGGFTLAAQMTTENPARNSLSTNSAIEARVWGLNGIYRAGPLTAGLAWQRYENNVHFAPPQTAAVDGLDDDVFVLGVNYTFGAFKLGVVATKIDAERVAGDLERKSYNVALDWNLAGPHMVRFGWTRAGKTTGAGTLATPLVFGKADQYQIQYNYRFSKRTNLGIGYVLLDNSSSGTYNLQALATGPANVRPGDKASAVAFQYTHTF